MASSDFYSEAWKQMATEISRQVFHVVNGANEHHTDLAILFFSSGDTDKSTFISSETDVIKLRKILRRTLKVLGKATIINGQRAQ